MDTAYYFERMDLQEDRSLAGQLMNKDEQAFEKVFKQFFRSLHTYAFTMVRDAYAAEEIVQQVFLKLWERAEQIQISGTVPAYLYRAVHNESLNYLKHQKVISKHQLYVAYHMKHEKDDMKDGLTAAAIEKEYTAALQQLPEQCRTVFQLSRFDQLKYREIAEQLGISVKTVEHQMGKALKILRYKLAEFLTLLIILLYH
ncbi:MAG: RNA polymerase sigma-70 factor [Ferruginibacter sp.]